VVLFQQQEQRLPRRHKRASKHEQSLYNWLDKAKQRMGRSLSFRPSERRLTITEAGQLTAFLNQVSFLRQAKKPVLEKTPVLEQLTLRGMNIQYPFSRLILSGVKSVECRRYPLGHRNLAHKNEDLFLIETRGTGDLEGALMESERDFHKRRYQAEADWIGEDRRMAHSQAIERSLPFTWPSHGMREMEAFREMEASREVRLKQEREMVCARSLVESFGPPPAEGQAQVIGIVRFSESKQYHHRRFRPIWSEDRSKHRIKEGGHHDWNGEEPMYAWYVDNVQPLSKPVPAGEYNKVRDQWGYRRPRTLDLATLSFVSA
jgi:hypothetical protein